jgi:hypothetical protein
MSLKMHFLEVCEINAWPNIRRVREARAAMAKKAARHPSDVISLYVAYLAGSHGKVAVEVHAGCRRSVLPRRIQHCKTYFVGRCWRLACTSLQPLHYTIIHAFANPPKNGVNYLGRGRGGGQGGCGKSSSSLPERKDG